MLAHALWLLATLPAADYNQTVHQVNQWFAYWGDHPIGKSKFAFHFDAHLRRANFFEDRQQFLLRPGIDYQLTKNIQLHSAYTWLPTYPYGKAPGQPQIEHRWWQQIAINTRQGKVTWFNRTRFEHRWLSRRYLNGQSGPANRIFEQRLRHTVRATWPINKAWYWSLGNEIFFPFPPENHPAIVDQHRAQLTFGKRLNSTMRIEYFYMNQVVWQRNGHTREMNHTIGIAFWNSTPLWNVFKPKG